MVMSLATAAHSTSSSSSSTEPNESSHPDLNDHDHEGMVFIGRLCHETGRRLSANVDNTIRYVFGTSFVQETFSSTNDKLSADHWSTVIDTSMLRHNNHNGSLHDLPSGRNTQQKTREQVLRERQERHDAAIAQGQEPPPLVLGPIPFGHVDTHPLDGGVTPVVAVAVEPYWLDATPVTNAQFAKFVAATYYETEAEHYGWSFVLSSFVTKDLVDSDSDEPAPPPQQFETDPEATHWVAVPGAYWRQPEGPSSSYRHREAHPVVHVSHRDAAAYCEWRQKRLPGEREYEAAARASHWSSTSRHDRSRNVTTSSSSVSSPHVVEHAIHGRTMYAWSEYVNETDDTTANDDTNNSSNGTTGSLTDRHWTVAARYANLWGAAGPFPDVNDAQDGWRGTSPVTYYPPNSIGVYDTTGNVWEWMRGGKAKARIVRGASYVDSIDGSTNHAATLGARAVVHGTTTAGNIGFRCAKAVPKRVEHHWTWHDEEKHGPLTMADEFGRAIPNPVSSSSIATDDDENENEDELDADEVPRKKKKVVLKPERIATEL
jgi:formylglycine-generating enzyme